MKLAGWQNRLKDALPIPVLALYRTFRHPGDWLAAARFVFRPGLPVGRSARLRLIGRLYVISFRVRCPHTQQEAISFIEAILSCPPDVSGCIVEAGSFKGGTTAKFSLAARLAGRRLVVFDSFEGIPPNTERHDRNIFGGAAGFPAGSYRGSLEEVRRNVTRFGAIEVCTFVKGWFEETMPSFSQPVAAAYVDVDLASSTRTCLKHLYPLVVPGGVLYSQDGHLPLVVRVLRDDAFWQREVGCPRPTIQGIGSRKLILIPK